MRLRKQEKSKWTPSTSWIWPYNHCGPGRSDGKWQNSVITTYGSTGPADKGCAGHDSCYATATTQEEFDRCDEEFKKYQWEQQGNYDGKIMGTLVGFGGKYFRPAQEELEERARTRQKVETRENATQKLTRQKRICKVNTRSLDLEAEREIKEQETWRHQQQAEEQWVKQGLCHFLRRLLFNQSTQPNPSSGSHSGTKNNQL